MQLKFWAMDESRVPVNAGTAEVYAASNATPGGAPITSASSNSDGMVTFTGLTGQADDIKFDKSGKGFWLKGFGEWVLSRLYLALGLIFVDQAGDPAAPGAGENILYTKAGLLYQRSGAAGAAGLGPSMAGNIGVGLAAQAQAGVWLTGTINAAGAAAFGYHSTATLVAQANNDALVALHANATFNPNSKTGVTSYGLLVESTTGAAANNYGVYINAPSGASTLNLCIGMPVSGLVGFGSTASLTMDGSNRLVLGGTGTGGASAATGSFPVVVGGVARNVLYF